MTPREALEALYRLKRLNPGLRLIPSAAATPVEKQACNEIATGWRLPIRHFAGYEWLPEEALA